MILRDPRFLFSAAALIYSTVPAVASPVPEPSQPSSCHRPEYPRRSLQDSEEGVTLIAFLVRADGTVKRSTVLNSSGSADLDRATDKALSKCLFKPATSGGNPVESWFPVQYKWSLEDDPGMSRAKHDAAIAAAKGDLAAAYQLSMLLLMTAKTDADREHSLAVLRSAADQGYAPAQFSLGRHYEDGDRMKADLEEALRWYQKAAAQGDVLAIQRLQEGAPKT
jgi:TonB family protein